MKNLVALALGRGDHFNEQWTHDIRRILHNWAKKQAGDYDQTEEPKIPQDQPFCLPLIGAILREGRDADFNIFGSLATGVTLGVLEPLPRTPAIFEEQVSWRLEDNPFSVKFEQKANYSSVYEHMDAVKKQFEGDIKLGRVVKMSRRDYEAKYPPAARAISALAALQEKDKVRTLTDGTHAVQVNNRIKCRDKIRFPGPREKFYLLDKYRARHNITFSLLGDIAQAHRLVKISSPEWGLMACELDNPEERYLNKVGTFGFSSAAYWFCRLISGVFRMTFMVLGPENPLDILLFADDVELLAERPQERRSILLCICILLAVGTPMKWSKFRGGFQTNWVGFHTDYRQYALGLSEERAQWAIKWTKECVAEKIVDIRDFQAGVGRLNFAAQALLFYRPFLGILYAWVSATARTGLQRATLPWAVALVLQWLGERLSKERLMTAPRPPKGLVRDWFRADAKATDTQAFIGGWQFHPDGPMAAQWFAMEITKEDFPWIYSKGSPKKCIAALELLATLLCVKTFGSGEDMRQRNCVLTASTDNQGNSFIIQKLLTTKYPSIVVLLELTEELKD